MSEKQADAIELEQGGEYRRAYADRSSTIKANATSQLLAAENPKRRALFIQNLSTDPLFIRFVDNAIEQPAVIGAPGTIKILPDNELDLDLLTDFVDTRAIVIIGATAGDVYTALEA